MERLRATDPARSNGQRRNSASTKSEKIFLPFDFRRVPLKTPTGLPTFRTTDITHGYLRLKRSRRRDIAIDVSKNGKSENIYPLERRAGFNSRQCPCAGRETRPRPRSARSAENPRRASC